jgi:hypothetical protein
VQLAGCSGDIPNSHKSVHVIYRLLVFWLCSGRRCDGLRQVSCRTLAPDLNAETLAALVSKSAPRLKSLVMPLSLNTTLRLSAPGSVLAPLFCLLPHDISLLRRDENTSAVPAYGYIAVQNSAPWALALLAFLLVWVKGGSPSCRSSGTPMGIAQAYVKA